MGITAQVCVALLFCIGITVVKAAVTCTQADDKKLKCVSCAEIGTCSGDTGTVTSGTEKCGPTQVCEEIGGSAFCVTAVGDTACNNCGAAFTGCDPYDPTIVHLCQTGKTPTPYGSPCNDSICQAGECSATGTIPPTANACASNTQSGNIAIKTVKPSCTSGVLCQGTTGSTVINCMKGQYFSEDGAKCKNLPINHCEKMSEGFAPHLTDCTKGILCQNGVAVKEIPCGTGQGFNSTLNKCVADTAGTTVCPKLDGCTFEPPPVTTPKTPSGTQVTPPGSISTPGPCNSSNVNKRYPVSGNCKKYLTCKLSSNIYQYVESSCAGTLVFNPKVSLCDALAKVPSCSTSSG